MNPLHLIVALLPALLLVLFLHADQVWDGLLGITAALVRIARQLISR